jgi:predicted MFS family arabinose efflux permease
MYSFFVFLQVLISMDHGIVPASTVAIADSFQIDESRLGFMGSAVFLGIVANGFFAGRVYQLFETKWVMIAGLICSQLSLMLLVLTRWYYVALLARLLTGAFQVFHIVFLPVWIDRNGGANKTSWITIFQTATPVGIFLGYALTAMMVEFYPWRYAFIVQIILILASVLVITRISDEQINIRGDQSQEGPDYMASLRKVAGSRLYIGCVLIFSNLLFVVTGIQFWMTDYFIRVLKVDKVIVNAGFVVISITAPVVGTIFGGYVIDRLGGYSDPRCLKALFFICLLCVVPSQLIPYIDEKYLAAFFLWSLLFWGGSMIPGLTGLIMVSVPAEYRSFGNSKAELLKNLIGYFPSPFIYGLTIKIFADPRAGLKMLMMSTVFTPMLMIWLLTSEVVIYRDQDQGELQHEKIKEIVSEEDID